MNGICYTVHMYKCKCGKEKSTERAKTCRDCFIKSIKGKVRVVHNKPHSKETKNRISKNRKGKGEHSGVFVILNSLIPPFQFQ